MAACDVVVNLHLMRTRGKLRVFLRCWLCNVSCKDYVKMCRRSRSGYVNGSLANLHELRKLCFWVVGTIEQNGHKNSPCGFICLEIITHLEVLRIFFLDVLILFIF